MPVQVNVHEAKTHFSKLLNRALAGEEVIIMRSGRPLVRLTPVMSAPANRQIGTAKGEFVVPGELDDPLQPDVLAGFYK